MQLTIITLQAVQELEVLSVDVVTANGTYTFLPGHAPAAHALLCNSPVTYTTRAGVQEQSFVNNTGIVSVERDHITLMLD